jgi:hypothetical protein
VCVYYCSTYYKAVREGRGVDVEDMCYERLRAEAYVNYSAHCALMNAGTGHGGPQHQSAMARWSGVCLLLQYLLQSCSRGGGGGMEDMCYERLRAEAGVN